MKRIVLCALAVAAGALLGQSVNKQKLMSPNPKSPPMETSVTISGKQIWIVYHAPSARGRKIFGGAHSLVPDGEVWRLGADWATVLHTDADLDFNGVAVPKGDYSLFLDPDKGKWQLIVNKQTGQWGINRNGGANLDPSQNVGRVPLTMSKPAAPVEQLKIALSAAGGNQGKLLIEWANLASSASFTAK